MSVFDKRDTATADVAVQQSVSRRSLLRLAFAGAGIAATGPVLARSGVLSGGGGAGVVQQGAVAGVISGTAPMAGPRVRKFERELVVPPVLAPTEVRTEVVLGQPHQVDYYDMEQREAVADLLPAPFPPTPIWGYNGIYPGPVFRQTQNGPYTVVRNSNTLQLGTGTSTHLHGSPTQPAHDGHPDDLTYPHGTDPEPLSAFWDDGKTLVYCPQHQYRYPNGEDTRTLWYHDHGMHATAKQVYRGLVSMFIQEPDPAMATSADPAVRDLYGRLTSLPSAQYDVPLIVADMQFDQQGNVAYDDGGHDSLWGNVLLVNGRAWPRMTVDKTKYRFRFLVADLSRGYNFALGTPSKGHRPVMTMIGTDAGMLAKTVQVTSWRQGMAERYEVVIDFSMLAKGETVTLLNTAADGDMGQVLRFVGSGKAGTQFPPVPASLNTYTFGQEEPEVVNPGNPRYFRFERSNGEWVINGLPWTGAIAAKPSVGTTELWVLENKSGGWFHPVHIHLVDFQVVRRNGSPPPAYEQGWKDVVYVGPNERVELVMRFNAARQMDPDSVPVAERKPITGKYVMHCHNLIHEDNDMMTQFQTQPTAAGAAPAALRGTHAGHDMRSMMVQWELKA